MNLTMRKEQEWAVALAFWFFGSTERHIPRVCKMPASKVWIMARYRPKGEWRHNLGVRPFGFVDVE
jgi:hypothetical protein